MSRQHFIPSPRRGNFSIFDARAHPASAPAAQPESAAAGWYCTICHCVLPERLVHAGCSATAQQMSPHVVTKS
jgi:hypothetical protein